jgi:hypothetical protein
MMFEVTDPKMIAVVCGQAKKFHVTVDYLPGATSGPGLAGELKAIRY